MKIKFSKHWQESKQPRKQRKYLANAPLHLKRKLLNTNISKELRSKYKKRSIAVRKGDTVKIMRGKFKGKTGKIIEVNSKKAKLKIEGIMVKKQDGSKVSIKFQPSNLQIIELNLDDKKRIASINKEKKETKNMEEKTNSSKTKGDKK